ncbi:MAG: GlxA family transcriptional regulator, partial [Streptomyces sp.]|nr:GlxA family transcriptional regulator [Streptomyces sp.]
MTEPQARRAVVVGYDGAELLDIAGVTSTLDIANRLGATPAYDVCLASPDGASIRCDSGRAVHSQTALRDVCGP